MARDPDSIERDIVRAREDLPPPPWTRSPSARIRSGWPRTPSNGVVATLNTPAVKYPLIGVGVLVLALTIKKLVS